MMPSLSPVCRALLRLPQVVALSSPPLRCMMSAVKRDCATSSNEEAAARVTHAGTSMKSALTRSHQTGPSELKTRARGRANATALLPLLRLAAHRVLARRTRVRQSRKRRCHVGTSRPANARSGTSVLTNMVPDKLAPPLQLPRLPFWLWRLWWEGASAFLATPSCPLWCLLMVVGPRLRH